MTGPRNTIRTFALICVAVTTVFVIAMSVWSTKLLSTQDWCVRAIGASQAAERPEAAISGCFALLKQQVAAIAWNSHIHSFVVGFCLLVLIVIVIAVGKVSFSGSKDGVSGFIGQSGDDPPPVVAAARVAEAAASEADQIAEEVKP